MTIWNIDDIGDLSGKTALITGANSGVGLETARALGRAGCRIILACRSAERMSAAASSLRAECSGEIVETLLDLSDLESVRDYAKEFNFELDFLVLNAGLALHSFQRSSQGYEIHFAVNHLAHWLLAGELFSSLTADARIIAVSSVMHRTVSGVDLAAARCERPSKDGAYGMSKLANLLFVYELNRRLKEAGRSQLALAAHPGYSSTAIFRDRQRGAWLLRTMYNATVNTFAQTPAQGARSIIMACTDKHATRDSYYAPGGLFSFELWGAPIRTGYMAATARDPEKATELWEASEYMTNFKYNLKDGQK